MRNPILLAAIAASLAATLSAQGATSSPCFVGPLGTALNLGDDDVSQGNALGFTFPGPAGPVTSIDISSNGFVWLASSTDSGCCNADVTTFLTGLPRIAVTWMDLNPTVSGDVYFNALPASGSQPASAIVTWSDVPEYGTTTAMTSQLQLFADGSFRISFDARAANTLHDLITGVTEGTAAVANPVDLSGVTSGNPHNSGTNPTIHDLQLLSFDLAGRSFAFIPNGTNGYLVLDTGSCAVATTYGVGCPDPVAAYEMFTLPAVFDMANTSLDFTPSGAGGYVAIPGTGFFAGASGAQTFFDDDVQTFTLPFNFPFGGGMFNSLDVSSNGFAWVGPSNFNSRCCNGDVAMFLADGASLAPLWMDLNPSAGGTIYFDVDPVANEAHVTWSNVPEYGTSNLVTAQLTVRPNGSFRFAWQAATNATHDVLVGFSNGAVPVDPGSVDFSAGPVISANGGLPLRLTNGSWPALGTTYSMIVDNVQPGSLIGLMVFGFTQVNPGFDLSGLGMPGCELFTTLDVLLTFPIGAPSTFTMSIPNTASIVGFQFFNQAATLTPGINQFGAVTSNGLASTVGN